jgi:hypothetical protein
VCRCPLGQRASFPLQVVDNNFPEIVIVTESRPEAGARAQVRW